MHSIYVIIANLAIADLMIGMLIMPKSILVNLLYEFNVKIIPAYCWIGAYMNCLVCTASVISLCIISFERYKSINNGKLCFPALSSTYFKNFEVKASIIIWSYATCISILPLIDSYLMHLNVIIRHVIVNRNNRSICIYQMSTYVRIVILFMGFLLPTLYIVATYIKIYQFIKKIECIHNSQIKNISQKVQQTKYDNYSLQVNQSYKKMKRTMDYRYR
ncbi:hypothetical protein A3Q56_05862 [Intoshia linei]|uniref:G-protein coupled receptors family 1 profile domain-containing protein n=1 Tax=Intoshia linei TaxID=1819745 RepID=A0A177AWI3_9BILA|nr:hypothetical protein A3Q56_05862 [Intoshia linei]